MSKFKFNNPLDTDRPNPFRDGAGENPFGDGQPSGSEAPQPTAANPYSAQDSAQEQETSVQPYRPEDYETFLPHRAGLVYWLGLSGCFVQTASVVIAAIAVLLVDEFTMGLAYGVPTQLFGLALGLPAWILGHSDLKAIRAGAMDQEGERDTKRGLQFGIAATLLGIAQIILLIGLEIYSAYYF